MKILGKKYPRIDGAEKVTGRARYTYDQFKEGMLYGAILGSRYPAAKIVKIDDSMVWSLPGVKAVLTDVHPTGRVRYVGEEIAAVAATTPEILGEALRLFRVEYEKLPFTLYLEEAMKDEAPRVFPRRSNVNKPRIREEGNVEQGFAQAEVVLEDTFRTQVQIQTPLESHGSMVYWDGDELIIYDSTQAVHGVREGIAKMLDMPLHKVRVICHHMGGGFGSKLQPGIYTVIAARLAKQANAPVRLMLDRQLEFLTTGNRPDSLSRIKMGAKRDGTITAFFAKTYGTAGIGNGAGVRLPIVYSIPNVRHEHHDVYTNAGAARPFRAPGCPQASFAMEQMMDEMAEKLGMDPLQFRLKNDSNPTRQKEWMIGAERFGWHRRKVTPASDPGPIKRGMGLGASIWWPGGRGTKASMKIYSDGSVEVFCGTQDLGTGTRTHIAAVAAEELGLELKQIKVHIGDSNYPRSGASGGSTTSPSVAPAIKNTAEKARQELGKILAEHWNVSPEAIIFSDGYVIASGEAKQRLSWKEACGLLETDVLEVHGEWSEGLSSSGVAGCQFAEVEVDTDTGKIRVLRIVAVADCGLILDRLTTESQVNGGIIQGISYALFEERLFDPQTGAMVNPNFETYKIVGTMETPEIEVILFDEPERGVIGIGEPPTIPTSGAIANAVYNAIGVRIKSLPMTPDKVLQALANQKA
ncbi:MAG: xanthine dehydrogenase family protein molybdopterin-binding subunit [Calditrichaeota bacterium]|nr:MAG: xanthine dehydrogenase family protein molybdopterin-binding subunit [Calditrichota bacterium]